MNGLRSTPIVHCAIFRKIRRRRRVWSDNPRGRRIDRIELGMDCAVLTRGSTPYGVVDLVVGRWDRVDGW